MPEAKSNYGTLDNGDLEKGRTKSTDTARQAIKVEEMNKMLRTLKQDINNNRSLLASSHSSSSTSSSSTNPQLTKQLCT